jgi:hypothetical protein
MASKKKSEKTEPAVDTKATAIDAKHSNGGWNPAITVEEILAKHAKGVKLLKEEVAALRAVGLKKNGEKLMDRSPRDPLALNSEKMLGAIDVIGVKPAISTSFANADTEDKKTALKLALVTLVRRLRSLKTAAATALSESIIVETRVFMPTFGKKGGGKGPRSVDGTYAVTTGARAVFSLADLGATQGDRFRPSTVMLDGEKVVVIRLVKAAPGAAIEAQTELFEDDGLDDEASPFNDADPASV